jgi:hypothetical protein
MSLEGVPIAPVTWRSRCSARSESEPCAPENHYDNGVVAYLLSADDLCYGVGTARHKMARMGNQ